MPKPPPPPPPPDASPPPPPEAAGGGSAPNSALPERPGVVAPAPPPPAARRRRHPPRRLHPQALRRLRPCRRPPACAFGRGGARKHASVDPPAPSRASSNERWAITEPLPQSTRASAHTMAAVVSSSASPPWPEVLLENATASRETAMPPHHVRPRPPPPRVLWITVDDHTATAAAWDGEERRRRHGYVEHRRAPISGALRGGHQRRRRVGDPVEGLLLQTHPKRTASRHAAAKEAHPRWRKHHPVAVAAAVAGTTAMAVTAVVIAPPSWPQPTASAAAPPPTPLPRRPRHPFPRGSTSLRTLNLLSTRREWGGSGESGEGEGTASACGQRPAKSLDA